MALVLRDRLRFLDLPSEIRNKIYRYSLSAAHVKAKVFRIPLEQLEIDTVLRSGLRRQLLDPGGAIHSHPNTTPATPGQPSSFFDFEVIDLTNADDPPYFEYHLQFLLLRMSRQVRAEAEHIFHNYNLFVLVTINLDLNSIFYTLIRPFVLAWYDIV